MVPDISVIMSVYNTKEEFLRAAIESILNQTFNNFEFIIVLDCPMDGSQKIIEEYAAADNRIVVIKNEENIGLTKSLNKALEKARGEFIARMDADDYSMPERFEKQLAFLYEHKDVGVVGSYAYVHQKGHRGMMSFLDNYEITKIRLMFFNNGIPHPSAMFRKIMPDGTPVRYDESIKKSQDYALWSVLIKKTKISCVPEFLILYRVHEGQISNAPKNQFFYSKKISQRQLESFVDFSSNEQYRNIILDAYYGEKRTKTYELTEAFSFLIAENKKIGYFPHRIFLHSVRELQIEYLINNRSKIKNSEQLLKSIKGISPAAVALFVRIYIIPRLKYDIQKNKFKNANSALLNEVL